jgi:hypothetical protein
MDCLINRKKTILFDFQSLDNVTRKFMRDEFDADLAGAGIYHGARLSAAGWAAYPAQLRIALASGDADTFTAALSAAGAFNEFEPDMKNGGTKRVPSNAPALLGEGEFNRYYERGVCARALAEGATAVEVYRGRVSSRSRPESEAAIGTHPDAAELLARLRQSHLHPESSDIPEVGTGVTIRLIP